MLVLRSFFLKVNFIASCFRKIAGINLDLPKTVGARLIVTIGINLTLTPLWLSIMYGNAYKFMVPARLIKNIAMIPIDIFLLYTVLKFCEKNKKRFK